MPEVAPGGKLSCLKLLRLLLVPLLCMFFFGCSGESDTFQGYVEGDFVYMASSQAGQLTRLQVTRGSQAATGDPLFELEHGQELTLVAQRQEELKSTEALLNDMLTGQRPLELDVTRAQLEQARAIARDADGVVVGSALVSAVKDSLTKAGKPTAQTVPAVHALVRDIAQGVRNPS